MLKRLLSLFLCMALLLSNFPVVSFAAEDDGLHEHHPEHTVESRSETVTVQIAPDFELPENKELFEYFVERELYGYDVATYGTAARETLNAAEKAIYDVLKSNIEAIALNGGSTVFEFSEISGLKTEWTNTELGVDSIDDLELVGAELSKQFNLDNIVTALLSDCPLDLYWYNKTAGMRMGYSVGRSYYQDGTQNIYVSAKVTEITFTFPVAEAYQSEENTVTSDVEKVTTARNNAMQIVNNHASKSDYEKLAAYKEEICNAVSYNHAAAENDSTPYGDPWQLIYVFDGDPSTNVVCEGYAKAFQYLCDLSTFADDTICYTVTGWMDLENHMWNIVTLEGKNYLVDVTNSDAGSVGQDGSLFLAGASGSAAGGYSVAGISYVYDDRTLALWGTGTDSILAISADNYALTAGDWTYEVVDGKCKITGYTGNATDVVIPAVLGGFSVYSIGTGSFNNENNVIQSLTIGAGIQLIEDNAFVNFQNLKNVYYAGTKNQWTALGTNAPAATYIHYGISDPTDHWQAFRDEPTCGEVGYSGEYCMCDYIWLIEEPATGEHVYNQNIADEKYLAGEGTCTATAVYYRSCVCGAIGTETFETDILNPDKHNFVFDVCACGAVRINADTFPDANFRAYIQGQEYGQDNVLTSEERNKVTSMNVASKQIADLTGIGYFTALETLHCEQNSIKNLDVSKNTALKELYCEWNALVSLDVSGCTALEHLECYNNQLPSLDVSKNTALKTLICHINNQMTSLDVSKNTALKTLVCSINYKLTSLNVKGCTALERLECGYNRLTSLDVSGCTALEYLDCNSNQLTSLDVSGCIALKELNCHSNQLTSLDVSGFTALTSIFCNSNQLTSLNVSGCTALTTLSFADNKLTSLNVSGCTALTGLNCSGNQLVTLNISGCTALTSLECSGNKLTSLDMSSCTKLKTLDCSNNQLTSLLLNGCTALTELRCDRNLLTNLDVTQSTNLTFLYCYDNQLTSLNVSGCVAMTDLSCYNNQLVNLNLNECTALTYLFCSNNQLTSLDVSDCTKLLMYSWSGNSREVSVENNQFDLSVLAPDGFDVNKASNWQGGTVNGNILTVTEEQVTYTYDSGNNKTETFTLVIKGYCEHSWKDATCAAPKTCRHCGSTVGAADPQKHNFASDVCECGAIAINQITFPDQNFRNFIKDQEYGLDGVLTGEERNGVTSLALSGKSIENLAGIEYFTSLTHLDCSNNLLKDLDVSKCAALTNLNCAGNRLSTLDVSNDTVLAMLICDNNQLTGLNVKGCTGLTSLDCSDNQLTSLDVSECAALVTLDCSGNRLTGLDVSDCTALVTVNCQNNSRTVSADKDQFELSGQAIFDLSELEADGFDFDKATNWQGGTINGTVLTANGLSVTYTYNLGREISETFTLVFDVFCDHSWQDATCTTPKTCALCGTTDGESLGHIFTNYVSDQNTTCTKDGTVTAICDRGCGEKDTKVDEGTATGHSWQDATCVAPKTCLNCGATEGDVNLENHQYISDVCECGLIRISAVSFPDENFRAYITSQDYGSDGFLTSKEIGKVTSIRLGANNIRDLTGIKLFTALTELSCNNNQLTSLDLSACTALQSLSCQYNQMTSLNVSGCAELTSIFCNNNKLTSLDVSTCTALTQLNCYENMLTSLDVSNCPEMYFLLAQFNQLTSLNVKNCTKLAYLQFNSNQVKTLDVSDCVFLWYLNFGANQLTHFDTSVCPKLSDLWSFSNSRTVFVVQNRFDLSTLAASGFEISKTSNWQGGSVSGTILTATSPTVTYTYNMGNGKTEEFTLLIDGFCNHTWIDATCTVPKTCSSCNATEGNAKGHSWQGLCTEPKICSACQATNNSTKDHSWTAATCTAPKTCSDCKVTEGTAKGHNWVDATCTTAKTCSVCKETEGNAKGHNWTDATCTEAKTCSICKETEGNAKGHSWIGATCTEAKTCSVCKTTEGTAKGHNWMAATTAAPKTCSSCGATEGEKLPPSVEVEYPTSEDVKIETDTGIQITEEKKQEIIKDIVDAAIQVANVEHGINADENKAIIEEAKENMKIDNGEQISDYSTTLAITLEEVELGDSADVKKVTYDVTPWLYALDEKSAIIGETKLNNFVKELTFRLPVDKKTEANKVRVWHEDQDLGLYPIMTDENGNKYVEVKSAEFSRFAVEIHNHSDYVIDSVVTAPTCTEEGYTTYICECGDSYIGDKVAALGHDWNGATCTTPKTCKSCGTTEGNAKGHSWTDATCTTAKTCKTCGTTEGGANGHIFDQEKVDPKYLVSDGVYYKSCKCGERGTETFTVKEDKPEVKPEDKPEEKPEDKPVVKPVEFKDVPTDAFYYNPVMWAVQNKVTSGTGDGTTFSPDEICTRGQVVTFLWRAAGQPEPKNTTNPFTDVKESDFFYKAVLWAVENKVTTGTGDGTTFAPNENCNRGQIVTFLSRAKGGKATTSTNPFTDVAENAFYYNPVLWAVEKGITTGTGDGTTFAPDEDCTRGQVITFLYRAYK